MKRKQYLRPTLGALTALSLIGSANAALLVAWHDFDNALGSETADYKDPFLTSAEALHGLPSTDNGGSSDGVYGSGGSGGELLAPPVADNGFVTFSNSSAFRLALVNNSPITIILTQLYFDLSYPVLAGQQVQVFSVLNGGTPRSVGAQNNNTPIANATGNYGDTSLGLDSFILTPFSTMDFFFTSITDPAGVANIDNIAITSEPIPEPASLVALGCILSSGLFMRTRRRTTSAVTA